MARVRIISNRVVLAGGVSKAKGEEVVGPAESLHELVRTGSAEWVEGGPVAIEPEPVLSFASASAADLATAEGLTAAEFEGVEPSGKGGHTKADVEAVLQARG
jgi:hypothetical protein